MFAEQSLRLLRSQIHLIGRTQLSIDPELYPIVVWVEGIRGGYVRYPWKISGVFEKRRLHDVLPFVVVQLQPIVLQCQEELLVRCNGLGAHQRIELFACPLIQRQEEITDAQFREELSKFLSIGGRRNVPKIIIAEYGP